MNSRIFTGQIMHARAKPVQHRFQYPVYFYGLDIDQLDELDRAIPLFGHNRVRPVAIHDGDYLLPGPGSLREKVEQVLHRYGANATPARVDLITSARYLHYVFNPVSFFYCYGEDGSLENVIVQVNNTFGEMHVYVLGDLLETGRGYLGHYRTDKVFHVSPFFPRKGSYEFFLSDSRGDNLDILLQYRQEGDIVFAARLRGSGRSLNPRNLNRALAHHPLMAALTIPRIMWQASRLHYQRRLPVYHKPPPASPGTIRPAPLSILERFGRRMALRYLSRIRQGELTIEDLSGQEKTFGFKKHEKGRTASITIMDNRFYRRTLLKGEIGLGESYTAGEWKSADLPQFLSLLSDNLTQIQDHKHRMSTLGRALEHVRHALRPNTVRGSRSNITEHYDLSNDFFSVFLDSTMTYSCALFENPDDDLETAQINKIRSVIQKADISPGDHVLEIGCGWGSFAMEAARTKDCDVTGITISKNQLEMTRGLIREGELEDRVTLELRDYRHVKGAYDAIVSIEMLEAVGHANLDRYFSVIEEALKPGSLAVIQVITIPDERYNRYRKNPDWIRKHIFPGGHLPSLSALKEAVARTSGLSLLELTDIGSHYARTLALWRKRLLESRDKIISLGYDEAFIRKWEYYFAYCEAGFSTDALQDHQMVLEKTGGERRP